MSTAKTLAILAAEPRSVTVPKLGELFVAELSAVDLEAFLLKLSAAAGTGFAGAAPGTLSVNAGGFSIGLGQIDELIRNATGLSIDLVARATGRPPAEIGALPARVLLELVDLALEVNITEDFFAPGKRVARRLGQLFPAAQTGSVTSSKASAPTAIPSPT